MPDSGYQCTYCQDDAYFYDRKTGEYLCGTHASELPLGQTAEIPVLTEEMLDRPY